MFSVGIDIGGTFTDCVLIEDRPDGGATTYATAKVLSTKENPADGVLTGLADLAGGVGLSLRQLLGMTRRFGHGTTIGTNAVLERTGARVGVITTAGHGDALAIMRGHGRVAGRGVEDVFRVRGTRLPAPLIVPGAVLEVHERVDARGRVVVALDEGRTADAVAAFIAEYRLDSVAVAFLWSFANQVHELAVEKMVQTTAPDVFVSLSSRVSPRLGEFERTVATVLNGYVGPACTSYLTSLGERLVADGLQVPLLVMQSSGGVVPASGAAEIALGTLDSGPTAGLTGSAALAAANGHRNVVATDMGGTSFDIGLIIEGQPVLADESVIDQYTYRLPHVDVRTTACGGGTIARRDPRTGALRVGPDSAGAEPGPACYGRGGDLATVTDADLVLGLLRPDSFLDGRMPLDRDAANAAVGRLAEALGLSVEQAAAGIVNVNNLHAATLIRQQTLERGLDPRDFVLYSYGGAGPVHAFGYAAEIGVREVLIPLGNGASTLSAYGIAAGDVTRFVEVETALRAPFDDAALSAAVAGAVDRARQAVLATGVTDEPQIDVWALMRFQEQLMHSLEVPVAPDGERPAARLVAGFTGEYAQRYGASAASAFQAAEVFALRVRARVPGSTGPVTGVPAGSRGAARSASVFWPDGGGYLSTAIHDGTGFADGDSITGPALVELPHTTIAVPRGGSLTAERGHFRLVLPDLEATTKEGNA
ncbi:hydantoinase/oxoprolinase family protein [Dactylosporangium darangshiense]|uniref:N-methylhydantoinase A n=1 Tax=Dactylosporangium darangshiense TaxID=579108 RepID=A0ABP8DUC7_9ACTN